MDLPKCRICGERHRLGPCPSVARSSRSAKAEKVAGNGERRFDPGSLAKAGDGASGKTPLQQPGVVEEAAATEIISGPAFDRQAYQRDYMRRYRARKRAEREKK